MQKIIQGDSRALSQVMTQYGNSMKLCAYSIAPHASDDIVQDAWISAWRALPAFEFRCSLKTWLIQITLNHAYGYLRKFDILPDLKGGDSYS